MKKVFMLFMIVATMMSCSKDEGKTPLENSCVITSMSSSENKYDFEYDSQGRIILAKGRIGEGVYILREEIKFSYLDNTITLEKYEDGELDYKEIYYLENGKIAYVTMLDDNQKMIWKEEFEYNSDSFLSKITSYETNSSEGYITTIQYSNENITSLSARNVRLSTNATIRDHGTFTPQYNTDELRMPFIEFNAEGVFSEWFMSDLNDAILYEQGLFGKVTKNRIISESNTNTSIVYDTKDSNGKTKGARFKHYDNAGEQLISLVYNCN